MDDFDETKMFSASAIKTTPLSKYYRLPGVHILPPTRGKFLPQDFVPAMNGDIPIFPMKAQDEMLLKNPDALLSGLALEKLFESCIPSIANPRLISMPDIDTFLLAIRLATYGEKMNLDVTCPQCKAEYEYVCDLPTILGTIEFVDDDTIVKLNEDIHVCVRPYSFKDASEIAFMAFDETRLLQNIDASAPQDDEGKQMRMAQMNSSMKKVSSLTEKIMTNCIDYITVPEGTVNNKREILEFIRNISKSWYEVIDNRIQSMNKHGVDKKLHISCDKCQCEWDTSLEIDPTNFFDASS